MGLKNKREAILEFLRVPIREDHREDHKYLVNLAYQAPNQTLKNTPELSDVAPYNQAELLLM